MLSPKKEKKNIKKKSITPLNSNKILKLSDLKEKKNENYDNDEKILFKYNENLKNKYKKLKKKSLTSFNQRNYNSKPISPRILKPPNYFLKEMKKTNSHLFINNSNLLTQGNSFQSKINNISQNTFSDNKTPKINSRNSINFMDRQKLKSTKLMGLKLYEEFEVEHRQKNKELKNDYSNSNNNSLNNSLNKDKYNFKKNNSFLESFMTSKDDIFQKRTFNKRRINYSLNQLMKLNPYHYVSTRVRYNNAIEIKKISEKLGDVNSEEQNKIISTYKTHFFKNKKINSKIIKTFKVNFNNNLSYKGGLVWRILSKLNDNIIPSELKQICKLQGYTELWYYYGILLEKLLLNYPIFKWFLEKEKLMEENVFKEYIHCLKLDINIDPSFPNKVFLLFDNYENGKINIKDFYFIMKLTSSSSEIDKFNFFIKLFEDLNRKDTNFCINVIEVFEIFKNIIVKDWKKNIKKLRENFRKEFNENKKIKSDFYTSKDKMINFMVNNKYFKTLIDNFKKEYKFAPFNYNEKINLIFNSTVRNVKKFINEKNGVISICEHDIKNYEKILQSIQEKDNWIKKLKIYNNYIEGNNNI